MGMPVSAKHYVSYWGEGSNNDIRRWLGEVRVPILNVAHGIPLNELCNEYSSRQISELAAASPEVKTITVDGAPHSFAGHLMETSSIVTNYLRSKLD